MTAGRGACIHGNDRTPRPTGLVAGQAADRAAHIPAAALRLKERTLAATLPGLLAHAAGIDHGRMPHAWHDAVDADALSAVVCSHGPGHVDDRALRRGIQKTGVAADQTGHGGHVD